MEKEIHLPYDVEKKIEKQVWNVIKDTPDHLEGKQISDLSKDLRTALATIYWKDQEIKQLTEVIQRKSKLNK